MKNLALFALAVLPCVPATAQQAPAQRQPTSPRQSIEREILEMEQEVDKAALKEALMLRARQGMNPAPDDQPEKTRAAEKAAALREFIDSKKDAIIARSDELMKSRLAGMPAPLAARGAPSDRQGEVDRRAAYERGADAQVEVQLLQVQINLLQAPLDQAIQALATAEIASGNDESQREKAEAARKEYEKIKARYAELSKRLQMARQEAQSMQQIGGMGGFGGGFR
jgi:hypothetical protein